MVKNWNFQVTIGSWTDEFMADSVHLRGILAAVSLGGLALCSVLIWLLVRHRLRPLRGIVDAVTALGREICKSVCRSDAPTATMNWINWARR